jgi:ribonuclease G
MNKELYVSTTPHETKVALVEDDQLAEIYFERENEYTLAGSIYKGRVTRVLPGMQSAFVDIGLERDAFLYVSDFLELQDEDEDGEFADVKVTGPVLASANGLIVPEPQGAVEDESDDGEEEPAANEAESASGDGKDSGAPRWRGRRRRRGRRGGRDRVNGDRPAEAQDATSEAQTAGAEGEEEQDNSQPEAASPREPRKRELRGFEPRGLVVHGLARNVEDADAVAPEEQELEAPEADSAAEEKPAAYAPIVLPGESISKYSRGEGEAAPTASAPAGEESERSYGRRDRGDRDRGGRGRRGDRDRGRGGRDREREPREAREPREREALPENYTPIVLPGESISKYRGVEPVAVPLVDETVSEEFIARETVEAAVTHEAAPVADVESSPVETAAAPVELTEAKQAEENPDEPLSSASYSGVSGLPSLTQRHLGDAEEVEEQEEEVLEAPATEEHHEAAAEAPAAEEPAPVVAAAPAEVEPIETAPSAEAAPVESAPIVEEPGAEEDEPKQETRSGRRSWRDRVSKIFGAAHEPVEDHDAEDAEPVAEALRAEVAAEEHAEPSTPVVQEHQLGSFVIEGGHVEHEELDEEEAEMPALAEHFDRYDEGDEEGEEGNGSQFGSAVRDSGEESELEDEEYDFGGEEFEESELLADSSTEETEEEEGEEQAEGDDAEVAAAPEPGRPRQGRFDRRDRRGRRGAPQRGGGRMRPRQQTRALPLISELLKEGQEILVQIAKEPIGKKGARITSHIALPGRFLVYMPTVNHIGVSRKISSDEERQRLKRIVSSERENGHGGFIVRTAAANIKEDELRADIRFLKHLWTEIRTRAEASKSPALIYHDLNLVERILRDQVTSEFSQIWVDNESEYERVVRFASRFQPNLVRRIKLYTKDTPLYEQFGINEEINKSLKSKVWLKSGGYIVINQTEALVAIDINTGKYVGKTARLEDTIVKTNCDAVKEIVRQIRLRDLGGIIVVDFIDMDERKNRQKVMQALEEAMKADRAPSKILQFNDFGLVAITRKRVKQSLERTLGTPCPYCDATGFVKSVQTVCNEIYVEMRKIRRQIESKEILLRVNPDVAKELKNGNGKWLQEMEEMLGHSVLVKSDPQLHQEKFDMNY